MLLQRGARQVVALDVGHGQLDWRLRTDPRVVVREHVNARYLPPEDLPGPFDLVTIDVSFISLRQIFPVVPPRLSPDGHVVALVKPQFEAGREDVERGGLVTDPAVHARVLDAGARGGACGRIDAHGRHAVANHGRHGQPGVPAPPAECTMTIERVGIVAKQGLTAAAPHLAALLQWLETRGIQGIVETETAEMAGCATPPRSRATRWRRKWIC